MPPTSDPGVVQRHKRVFFWMNGTAFAFVAIGALLAWLAPTGGMSWQAMTALLLVLFAIALAATSYPFYRAFMRSEVERVRSNRPAKRR